MKTVMLHSTVRDNLAQWYEVEEFKGPTERFGVEVEMETNKRPPVRVKGWRRLDDGSLRGESAEYVFSGACDLNKSLQRINLLKDTLEKSGVRINDSFRAGVHVHMNVLDKTYEEVLAFLVMYYHVEELLIDFSGDNRVGNMFCLGINDAEVQISAIKDLICVLPQRCLSAALRLPRDMMKYSAMNISTMDTLGTIEYRAMQTNPDLSGIPELLDTFQRMWEKCPRIPLTVFELYKKLGPIEFAEWVLGDTMYAGALGKQDAEDMVRQNHSTILTILPNILSMYDKVSSSSQEKKKLKSLRGEQVNLNGLPPIMIGDGLPR